MVTHRYYLDDKLQTDMVKHHCKSPILPAFTFSIFGITHTFSLELLYHSFNDIRCIKEIFVVTIKRDEH